VTDLNRRRFWQSLFAAAPLAAASVSATSADDSHHFRIGNWEIFWSGWREAHNQAVRFGFWTAYQDGSNRMVYSTTTGVLDATGYEMQTLNTTVFEGWPATYRDTPEAFESAKQRARDRIMEKVRSL
jgi:hypothetical protein